MLKKQNGITLIALIITIIVMLILVGVTINVALNGGLFTKASEASKQMQVEAEKEELLSSVVAAIGYDGKVDLKEIQLPNGWKGTAGTYTSPKGNTYTVDENGKIKSSEESDSDDPEIPENIPQLFGNTQVWAYEFLGDGTGYLYEDGEKLNFEYTETTITLDPSIPWDNPVLAYEILDIKKDGKMVNRVLKTSIESDFSLLTTNGTTGLNTFDGRTYKSEDEKYKDYTIEFNNGICTLSWDVDTCNYAHYDDYICFEEVSNILGPCIKIYNEGETLKYDNKINLTLVSN